MEEDDEEDKEDVEDVDEVDAEPNTWLQETASCTNSYRSTKLIG